MRNKIKTITITLLSVIIFGLGLLGILIWSVNTISQNTAITTKFIRFQISRLLDLDSEVINPRAYLDWDLQYKIRADKLTFIHENEDLIAVDNVHLNVFLPYFALKKIYITQMGGENLYVDFERYENNKLNIIEIFNITGFFKVYFENSSISINKYFFKFTDKFHKPAESMIITGNNILLSKFTLKKYLQLIMDGEVNYNKATMPFLLDYNLLFSNAKKDYNLEVNLPYFEASVFDTYIKEFLPEADVDLKGGMNFKINHNNTFSVDANLDRVKFISSKVPVKFDYSGNFSLFSKLVVNGKELNFEEIDVFSKDIDVKGAVKIYDYTQHPVKLKFDVEVANTNGKSALALLPRGLPALNYAIDKAKDADVDGIVNGELSGEGIIGYIRYNGQILADNITLGYGGDLPKSSVKLTFKDDKMYIDGTHYPNYSQNEYAKIVGDVDVVKPIVLNLDIKTAPNMDIVPVQRALNIYSNIFNFPTGPVPLMDIAKGRGEVALKVKGTPPNVYLYGNIKFRDGKVAYPGLSGYVENVVGEIDFAGENIYYKNIKGNQRSVIAYANGQTEIHKNGLTHFYIDIPNIPLPHAQYVINHSSLLEKVASGLELIQNPEGKGDLNLMFVSDKNTIEPYVKGVVEVENSSCDIVDLAYRIEDVRGKVEFDSYKASMYFEGKTHGVDATLEGFVENEYSDLVIETPVADVIAAYEFIYNSPLFYDMRESFDDFSKYSGKIKTKTRLYGDFSTKEPNFYTVVDVLGGKLRYLDVKEDIYLKGGRVIAQADKVLLQGLNGIVYNAPFTLDGIITNVGLENEDADLTFKVNDIDVSVVNKLIGTQLLVPDANEFLSQFDYKTGKIDVNAHVKGLDVETDIDFKNACASFVKSNEAVVVKSGHLFVSEKLMNMNEMAIQMANSDILIDGSLENYQTNPLYNIRLSSNISEKDFNDTIVPMFNIPLSLVGKIYTNINFVGNISNWHIKMRAMLDDASYIFYKGANIGEGLSKFMFFDINGTDDDITINTLDIFSSDFDLDDMQPKIMGQVYGRIKNISQEFPFIEELEIKLNEYTNISFLNILFYDPNKPEPALKNGLIKGNVSLKGPVNDLSIIGDAQVKDAVISSINTSIDEMNVHFNEETIDISDANVEIIGSKAKINAVLANRFVSPLVIKNLDLTSDLINSDEIISRLSVIFENSNKLNNPVVSVTQPVVIEKGQLNLKELIYRGIAAQDVKADFQVTDDYMGILDNFEATITNGKVNGDFLYNFNTTDLVGNVSVDDVMANALASTFLNLPNEISGDMDGNIKFSTRGSSYKEVVENLDGTAHFKLYNGRMLRLGSIEYMLRIANTFKGGLSRLNLNAIVNLVAPKTGYFDSIEGDIQIQDGVILTDKITFLSEELNLFSTGSYNMNDSVVNATIIGQMPMESKESILWLGALGKISFNSLVRKLTKQAEKEENKAFFYNPLSYLNTIPGLKAKQDDYRFFMVSLKGNIYTEKYVDAFKWIK